VGVIGGAPVDSRGGGSAGRVTLAPSAGVVELELHEMVGVAGLEDDVLGEEFDDHALGGEFSDDLVQVHHGACQPVHGGHDDGVALTGLADQLRQCGAIIAFGAGLLLLVELVDLAEGGELAGEVLVGAGDSGVPDPLPTMLRHV